MMCIFVFCIYHNLAFIIGILYTQLVDHVLQMGCSISEWREMFELLSTSVFK